MLVMSRLVTLLVYCSGLAASEWWASQWLYSSPTIRQFKALLRRILRFSGARELEFRLSLTLVHSFETFSFLAALANNILPKEKGTSNTSSSHTAPHHPCSLLNPWLRIPCTMDLICLNICMPYAKEYNCLIIWSQVLSTYL